MGKAEWRASSDGPDWMDLAAAMWAMDLEHHTNTALFIEPVMSRGGGTVYICVSVRDREASVDPKPALALVQGYWPESEGRTVEGFIYMMLLRAEETAAAKLIAGKKHPLG